MHDYIIETERLILRPLVFLLFTFLLAIKIYAVVMYFISEKFRKKLVDEIEKSSDNAVATILTPPYIKGKAILHFLWDFTGAFVIKEENAEKNKPSAPQKDCKMT